MIVLRSSRSGSLTAALLFALPVLLMLFFLGINHVNLVAQRAATLRVTDASALAAGEALVTDAHLTADSVDLAALEEAAAQVGQQYADANPLAPKSLQYTVGQPDPMDDDIRFTTLPNPLDPTQSLQLIDTVEVIGKRTGSSAIPVLGAPFYSFSSVNIVARSKAVLDRRVLGLRPVYFQSIPLAPIALLQSDWLSQVQVSVGPPNSISQYTVALGDPIAPKSSFLFLGTTTLNELSVQLASGVTPGDLNNFNHEFVLDGAGNLEAPGEVTTTDSSGLDDLRDQILALQASGAARVWPLYSTNSTGTTTVVDFVAARVSKVGAATAVGANATLEVTLTPAFFASPLVVTDPGRTVNPYLARVHLTK